MKLSVSLRYLKPFIVIGLGLGMLSHVNPVNAEGSGLLSSTITVVADEDGNSFNTLLTFFSTLAQENKAASALPAPGGVDNISSALLALKAAQLYLSEQEVLEGKHVALTNRGLYGENRSGGNREIHNSHTEYCSSDSSTEVEYLACASGKSLTDQHAHIKASTLLSQTGYTEAKLPLIEEFVKIVTEPLPRGGNRSIVKDSTELSKPGSQKKLAQNYAYQAQLSLARESLLHAAMLRLRPTTTTEGQGGLSGETLEGKSIMEVLQDEATRRLNDEQWVGTVALASSESLLREKVHMQVINNYMQYLQLRQNERIEALLAGLLAVQIQSQQTTSEMISSANANF